MEESLVMLASFAQPSISWEELYRELAPELLGFLQRFTSDRLGAEDLLQETFGRAMTSRRVPLERREFRPWLFRIASNLAIDAHRRDRRFRMVSLAAGAAKAANPAVDPEGELVRAGLAAIP